MACDGGQLAVVVAVCGGLWGVLPATASERQLKKCPTNEQALSD